VRLPRTRSRLRRHRVLDGLRLAGEQVAQHHDRRACDGAAIGLEQCAATDRVCVLGPLYRQILSDAEERVRMGCGDRPEPRLHDEVACGQLPAGARQAFSKWDAFARCGQRGSVRPEWPAVGLARERQGDKGREPESPGVGVHRPPPESVRELRSLIERMEAEALMRCRIVTYRSLLPRPPARSEKKYSVVPSKESAGAPSNAVLLTVAPRLAGVDQGSSVLARVDTQMSWLPTPPTRPDPSDDRNISSPSRRMAVRVSRPGAESSATSTAGPNSPSSPTLVLA